jgi:23S rRNA U2552 (ribose-2'-O)-methylase RlmE/FtsJ
MGYILKLDFPCKLPKHSIKFNNKIEWNSLSEENNEIYKELIECKNKIELLDEDDLWDKAKKINNEYELIYLPNKKYRSVSIADYEALSRAFFKMWEILHIFKTNPLEKNKNTSLNILGLAEGPGGFIEAMNEWRKKYTPYIRDTLIGITLKSTNKDIPGWKKTHRYLNENRNIKIEYGTDETGNIYHILNVKFLFKKYNNSFDIVTADGGFDFSEDFNSQEQNSYRILFCESVIAMATLKKGGMYVCKFFDIFTKTTISIIQMLKSCFKIVNIFKPNTSRPCNSEKYIICEEFLGVDLLFLEKCFVVIHIWENIYNTDNKHINRIFDETQLEEKLLKEIQEFNIINTKQQIYHINDTLESIKNNNKCLVNDKLKNQRSKSIEWCIKYNMKMNKKNKYI